ncbi:MAG: protein kinase [Candidatus Eisenbacteria sp.]|nr:protein kinase [Candidatus Eisenbacteria bacterium]
MKCPHCQMVIPEGTKMCPHCGRFPRQSSTAEERTSQARPGAPPNEAPAGDPPPDPSATRIQPLAPKPQPYAKGRFEILEERPPGSMGRVFRIRDHKLCREAALKRLAPQFARDPRACERFLSEARSIAALSHPHIVHVYEHGTDADGDFILMEWVSGENLLDRLNSEGRLSPAVLHELMRDICDALAYAHRHNVIHLDLKPSNILVTEDGIPKLVDFGLARVTIDPSATRPVEAAGTTAYMPPEQYEHPERLDQRSDIFALAKTCYHLLTGQLPTQIDEEEIPKPLRKPLLRAMHRKPERRHYSVGEFWKDLEAGLKALQPLPPETVKTVPGPLEPTLSGPGRTPSPPTPGQETHNESHPPQRRRWPYFAALGAVLVLAAIWGVTSLRPGTPDSVSNPQVNVARLYVLSRQAYEDQDWRRLMTLDPDEQIATTDFPAAQLAELHYWWGLGAYELQDYARAAELFSAAVRHDETQTKYYAKLAWTQYGLSDQTAAERSCQIGLALDPENDELNNLAEILAEARPARGE